MPLNANAGDSIIVDASKSFDPDGDALRYNFYLDDPGRGIQYGIQIFCLGNGTYKNGDIAKSVVCKEHFYYHCKTMEALTCILTKYTGMVATGRLS